MGTRSLGLDFAHVDVGLLSHFANLLELVVQLGESLLVCGEQVRQLFVHVLHGVFDDERGVASDLGSLGSRHRLKRDRHTQRLLSLQLHDLSIQVRILNQQGAIALAQGSVLLADLADPIFVAHLPESVELVP